VAKPSQLALCELSTPSLDAGDRLRERHTAVEMVQQFSITHRLRCLSTQRLWQLPERTNFVDPAVVHHLRHAPINAGMELSPWQIKIKAPRRRGQFLTIDVLRRLSFTVGARCCRWRPPLCLVLTDRLSGQFPDFQRSNDTTAVVDMQTACRNGIDPGQSSMECRGANAPEFLGQSATQGEVGRWTVEQSEQHGLEIERGAADEEGTSAACFDVAATCGCALPPPGDTGGFPRVQNINQMMRNKLLLTS
jgi:hypothetical protein